MSFIKIIKSNAPRTQPWGPQIVVQDIIIELSSACPIKKVVFNK